MRVKLVAIWCVLGIGLVLFLGIGLVLFLNFFAYAPTRHLNALAGSAAQSERQGRTGLPLDLNFAMSKEDVLIHMKALDLYRVESGSKDMIAYVVPDPASNTKNGLFLKFSDENGLIEIASTKADMSFDLYEDYMKKLSNNAKE